MDWSIVGDLINAISDAKTVGAIATLAAIVTLIVKLGNTSLGTKLLGGKPWAKPLFAALTGAVLAALAAAASGQAWWQCLLAAVGGAAAGMTASGAHEVAAHSSALSAAGRDAGTAIRQHLEAMDEANVKPRIDELKAALDAAADIKDQKARLRAIANFLGK